MRGSEFKEIKQSGHGGFRPGAGRKPGRDRRPSCADCQDPRAAALATIVRDAKPFQFVLAMLALGAPIDQIRRALGMSQSQFAALYATLSSREAPQQPSAASVLHAGSHTEA
jgi:transposase-like protein